MPAIAFDRFYRYAELTELLHEFVRKFPHLVSDGNIHATEVAASAARHERAGTLRAVVRLE